MKTQQLLGESVNPVETDMAGNYTICNVRPGRYVLRVELLGYRTPLLEFSPEAFRNPGESARQRMSRDLALVEVRSRVETRADLTLERGASISGTVRFDDGSPAIGVGISLLGRNSKGEWNREDVQTSRYGSTDANGHYDIENVSPGEYLVRANLSLNEFSNSTLPMNGNEVHVMMTKTIFALPVYTGSVLRTRDATPLKIEGAQAYDGNDITLPISKLHRVSGALMASDGHPLNRGHVSLRYPDDNTEAIGIDVSRDDRQFAFPYVPEGTYTLAVEDARDTTEVEVPNAPGVLPRTHTEEKTVRRYGREEQPLLVQSDMEGVLAVVPDAPRDKAAGRDHGQ